MSRKDFSQQFPSPHKDFSQQFPSPPNEPVIVNTPPAENENQQQNTPAENEPVNNPPVENQPNTFGLTDEELFEQDLQFRREVEEDEERVAAARRAREAARTARINRELPYRWAMGLGPVPSESSSSEEDGWVSDDSFS